MYRGRYRSAGGGAASSRRVAAKRLAAGQNVNVHPPGPIGGRRRGASLASA
jgi:hypothetical protein